MKHILNTSLLKKKKSFKMFGVCHLPIWMCPCKQEIWQYMYGGTFNLGTNELAFKDNSYEPGDCLSGNWG